MRRLLSLFLVATLVGYVVVKNLAKAEEQRGQEIIESLKQIESLRQEVTTLRREVRKLKRENEEFKGKIGIYRASLQDMEGLFTKLAEPVPQSKAAHEIWRRKFYKVIKDIDSDLRNKWLAQEQAWGKVKYYRYLGSDYIELKNFQEWEGTFRAYQKRLYEVILEKLRKVLLTAK